MVLLMGATLTVDRFGNANSAYAFDGVDDYIYGSIIDTGQNVSIFAWVKSEDIFTENEFRRIFFNGYHYNADYPFWSIGGTGHANSIGTLSVGFEANSGFTTQAFSYTPPPKIDGGEWYFVGMTKNQNECPKLYVNGEKMNDVFELHGRENCSGGSVYNPNEEFSIGAAIKGSSHTFYGNIWQGKIDDIHIYNRTISESEIQELYMGSSCAADNSGVVSPNLDIHMPSLNYQSILGTQNIWADLEYLGTNSEGKHIWGLKDFGVNE